MMPPDRVETLRQVNQSLRSALARLRPEQIRCSAIRPEDFSSLLAEILRASECLQPGLASGDTSELDAMLANETREYRANLEKLHRFLPALHVRLLAEKARLEQARRHLAAAQNWARLTGNDAGR